MGVRHVAFVTELKGLIAHGGTDRAQRSPSRETVGRAGRESCLNSAPRAGPGAGGAAVPRRAWRGEEHKDCELQSHPSPASQGLADTY